MNFVILITCVRLPLAITCVRDWTTCCWGYRHWDGAGLLSPHTKTDQLTCSVCACR